MQKVTQRELLKENCNEPNKNNAQINPQVIEKLVHEELKSKYFQSLFLIEFQTH